MKTRPRPYAMTNDNDQSIIETDRQIDLPINEIGRKPYVDVVIEEEIERRMTSERQKINNILSFIIPPILLVLGYVLSAFFD